jgi:hypothetical protein
MCIDSRKNAFSIEFIKFWNGKLLLYTVKYILVELLKKYNILLNFFIYSHNI